MRVLIVEDDPHKLRSLARELGLVVVVERIDRASSLQQAMAILEQTRYDVVLLDMAIPSHAGEAGSDDIYSQPVGGLDILLYLSMDARSEAVIIVTQYPTVEYNREHVPLDKILRKLADDDIVNVKGVIFFGEDEGWRKKLVALVGMAS
jgi:response regulator of citrate/malate metabolism